MKWLLNITHKMHCKFEGVELLLAGVAAQIVLKSLKLGDNAIALLVIPFAFPRGIINVVH